MPLMLHPETKQAAAPQKTLCGLSQLLLIRLG
jgi:hypothetical protein